MGTFSRLCTGLICAFWIQSMTAHCVLADEPVNMGLHSGGVAGDRVMEIDREFLLELIHLARFNVHFFREANYHQKWRSWAYPLGREAGTAASFANSVIDISERGGNLSDPSQINRSAQRKGLASAVTGNAVSGTSSGLELIQNMWVMQRARKCGYSPGDSLKFVKESIRKTDKLLLERDAIISGEISDKRHRVRLYESSLLRRLRDQLVFEFRRWSINSRELAWRENTFFAIDAIQNFTNMSSSVISLQSFRHPGRAGPSALLSLVASSTATVNPLVRNLVGIYVRKHQRKVLSKELSIERPAMPEGLSLKELKLLQDGMDEKDAKRFDQVIFLYENSERLDGAIDRERKSIVRGRQVAQQQSISGPLIGLTSVARSILSTTAFYEYRDDKMLGNKLSLSGRISQASGQAYALIDTPYTYVKGVMRKKRSDRAGDSLAQILDRRLHYLDQLEQQLYVQKQ